MKTLEQLIKENEQWNLNNHCTGRSVSKDYFDYEICDQCGDYTGTIYSGSFKSILASFISDEISYELDDLANEKEFGLSYDDDYNYVLSGCTVDELTSNLMGDKGFLEDVTIPITVENEDYRIVIKELPKDIVVEAIKNELEIE